MFDVSLEDIRYEMRLYIMRHGETVWNTQKRLQGQTDIPLNENGRLLASETARGMKDIPFALAFTSPLDRAVETARIVVGSRQIPIIPDPRIQEISFGELEGRVFQKEADEAAEPELYRFFHAPERYAPVRGGETLEELYARTGIFLDELKTKREWYGKDILISVHGAASRALLANIENTPKQSFWGPGVPKNCAVTIVELKENEKWSVKELDKIYYENI